MGIPPSAARLRRSLQTLLRLYTEGELHEAVRAKYDVLVPHDVLDALRRCRPSFAPGHQHDAHEALSLILDRTGLDEACFRCGAVGELHPVRDSDVVILQEYERVGSTARLLSAGTLDVRALLTASLGRAETKLRVVPEILCVRFPRVQHVGVPPRAPSLSLERHGRAAVEAVPPGHPLR